MVNKLVWKSMGISLGALLAKSKKNRKAKSQIRKKAVAAKKRQMTIQTIAVAKKTIRNES